MDWQAFFGSPLAVWVPVLILVLIIVIAFRKQIGRLIERLTKTGVDVSQDGVHVNFEAQPPTASPQTQPSTWDTTSTAQSPSPRGVRVSGNRMTGWLLGIRNHIDVALLVENTADREERRAILTEAWFEDLRSHPRRLLIAFDTYEKAGPDVQEWISGPFLARAAGAANLRVLIAGQQVPDAQRIDLRNCCVQHPLHGVVEAEHWLPVVEAMGRRTPREPPLTWLDALCCAYKGMPKDIIQIIEGLPSKEAGA